MLGSPHRNGFPNFPEILHLSLALTHNGVFIAAIKLFKDIEHLLLQKFLLVPIVIGKAYYLHHQVVIVFGFSEGVSHIQIVQRHLN